MLKKKIIKNPVNNNSVEYTARRDNPPRTVFIRMVKGLSYMQNTTELKNARSCARCSSIVTNANNIGYKICLKRK